MPECVPGAPAAVGAALDRLKDELTAAAGRNFAGLILYGGLARGRYRPGKSDINVVVLLHDASGAALAAIAPALRTARRAAGVDPLLLTPAEIDRVADAFPTKFLDIKRHHVVLAGTDPFAGLEVSREQIRRRVAQELRNLLLRMRNHYTALGGDRALLTQALARVARPFALALQSLLELAGREAPDRTTAIFETAAGAFGLERTPLARLAELRQNPQPAEDVATVYQGVLAAVACAADTADQMKEPLP
jgi:hypothetical protein